MVVHVTQEFNISKLEASKVCHVPKDCREYIAVKYILDDLKVKSIRLLTNSPSKLKAIQ